MRRTGRVDRRCTRSRCARVGSRITASRLEIAWKACRQRRRSERAITRLGRRVLGRLGNRRCRCALPSMASTGASSAALPTEEGMPAPAKSQQQWIDGAVGVHLGALRHAAAANQAMDAPMLDITRALGFDSFLYAVCTGEARTRTWTTISTEWRALYEERRYMEVDPRFTHTRHRAAPCMWDSATTRREWQVQEFLRDAARFGIRSGVAVSFHDADHARIVLALDSVVTPVSARRLDSIERRLGDVMLLATSLHDLLGAK